MLTQAGVSSFGRKTTRTPLSFTDDEFSDGYSDDECDNDAFEAPFVGDLRDLQVLIGHPDEALLAQGEVVPTRHLYTFKSRINGIFQSPASGFAIWPSNERSKSPQSPLDVFFLIFHDDILDDVVRLTNLRGSEGQDIHVESDSDATKIASNGFLLINKHELIHMFGILLFMGYVNLREEREYWRGVTVNGERVMDGVSVISQTMSYDRFLVIKHNLRFTSEAFNENIIEDPAARMRGFLERVLSSARSLYIPARDLSIDELSVRFFGRTKLTIKNRRHKPDRDAFQLYGLSDSNGFLLNARLCTDKLPLGTIHGDHHLTNLDEICVQLLKAAGALERGHRCFLDNFYTSIPLFRYLKERGVLCVGTARANRLSSSLRDEADAQDMIKGNVYHNRIQKGALFMFYFNKFQ